MKKAKREYLKAKKQLAKLKMTQTAFGALKKVKKVAKAAKKKYYKAKKQLAKLRKQKANTFSIANLFDFKNVQKTANRIIGTAASTASWMVLKS